MSFDSIILLLLLLIAALLIALLLETRRRARALDELGERLRGELRGLFGQIEAYLSLRDRLGLDQGLPYTAQWSASPDFLKLIVGHALDHKPATIVECGSGVSTLMLARCCRMNGTGHVYSLEHDDRFAAATRAEIARYLLDEQATVIVAPLRPRRLNDREFQWYALDHVPDRSIDMLVIDGPPGRLQRHSRYPALPLLRDRLAEGCVVFLDDAARQDEREIVAMWRAEFPGLDHEFIRTERGCAVLRVRRDRADAAAGG